MPRPGTQRDLARAILRRWGIVRPSEFAAAGVTAATIGRMCRDGEVVHLARGLYQLPDAPLDAHHSLAEAAKRVPKGVVCLVSALAFHDLTDLLPHAVWMAIGAKDWSPRGKRPAIRVVRFTEAFLTDDVVTERIEGVPVKIFGVARRSPTAFAIAGPWASRWLWRGCRRRSGSARRRPRRSPVMPSVAGCPAWCAPISKP